MEGKYAFISYKSEDRDYAAELLSKNEVFL